MHLKLLSVGRLEDQCIITLRFLQRSDKQNYWLCYSTVAGKHYSLQAGRRLVRSLLTICDISVSSHPWAYVDNK